MKITKKNFGKLKNGEDTQIFYLENEEILVSVSDYGARVVDFIVKNQSDLNIALGYENAQYYEEDESYMGATVGRCANRIKNGEFTINNKKIKLNLNNGSNHLHGGVVGFDKKIWDSEILDSGIRFSYISSNLEENYPGEVKISVTYSLSNKNELAIKYEYITSEDTIVNPTNHLYFNLLGRDKQSLENHKLYIFADYYTEIDENQCSNGNIKNVFNTPLDFRFGKFILDDIDVDFHDLNIAKGYDQNFVVNEERKEDKLVAKVVCDDLILEVKSDMPGLHFYSGNFLQGVTEKTYKKRSGFALETQFYPNAINIEHFSKPLVQKNKIYTTTTKYKISYKD